MFSPYVSCLQAWIFEHSARKFLGQKSLVGSGAIAHRCASLVFGAGISRQGLLHLHQHLHLLQRPRRFLDQPVATAQSTR